MATTPQFTYQANNQSAKFGGTALTTSDGSGGTIGTSMILLYTPGANDSYVEAVRCIPTASVAASSVAATVIRIYRSTVNTGSPTATNTHLIAELATSLTTADQTTTAVNWFDIPLGIRLAGSNAATPEYLLISSHIVNSSNTNWDATAFGANY
jgi:hypothetical protein